MKHFFSFLFILFLVCTAKSGTFTVTNSGNSFAPASLTIAVGDTVIFQITTNHDAREVSQTTWNSNGTTSLTGGFQTAYGGGTVLPSYLTLGTHYYVCTPHAYLGMKGTITVVSCLPPTQPGTISGPANLCAGVASTFTVAPINGATSYSWSLPPGWSGSSSANTISVVSNSVSGSLTVAATSTCGSSGDRTLSVTVYSASPSAPASITGNTMVCSSSFNQYQASAVAGAQNYSWTLPAGWQGSSQNVSIGSLAGANGGVISVQASNVCGLSLAQTLSVSVTSGTALPAPSVISGNTLICAGTSQKYTVSNVAGATSYSWSFPAGFTGASGNTTINSVTSGTNSGFISVTANNICGASAPRTLAVVVSPAAPGAPTPILGNTVLCAGTAGTFSVAPVPLALSYSWSVPGNWTGTSTTTVLNFTTGAATGSLYVSAINACGPSPVNLLVPIVSTAVPAPSAIEGPTLVCPFSAVGYSIPTVAGALEYMWMPPMGWTGGSSNNFFGGSVNDMSGDVAVQVMNGCGTATEVLSVIVYTFDVGVFDPDGGLNASPSGEIYQWLDCDNSMAAIPGATTEIFNERNGFFAVIVTQLGCADTSDCVALTQVGLLELKNSATISVFPNPAKDLLTIKTNLASSEFFEIIDFAGRPITKGLLSNPNTEIDISHLPRGLYIITVPGLGVACHVTVE